MKSLQSLRERHHELSEKARNLIDANPGASWSQACQKEYDGLIVQIDAVAREISDQHDMLDGMARDVMRKAGLGADEGWVDNTGKKIHVAYAKAGSIKTQLQSAFRGAEDKSSLSDFLRGVAGLRSTESVRNALSTGTDSAGGYVLPSFLQLELLAALAPVSSLLTAGAGIALLEEGAKSHRIAAVDTIPTAAWRAEGGALATSDPALRSVDIVPRSLSFQFKASRELLADSANLEQALFVVIAQAFAKEVDRAGLRGSGIAPEPRGLLNTTGIQAVTNGVNGASLATTAYSNLVSAMQAILQADAGMPKAAIMSPRSLSILAGLLDSTSQPRSKPEILRDWNLIATSQVPNTLTVGTSTDCSEIYVGDFSKVVFFLREGFSVQLLNELYASTGEIGFACHARVDVAALYPAGIAVVTGVRP